MHLFQLRITAGKQTQDNKRNKIPVKGREEKKMEGIFWKSLFTYTGHDALERLSKPAFQEEKIQCLDLFQAVLLTSRKRKEKSGKRGGQQSLQG